MDLTFREKSLWLVGLSLVLVFGFYSSRVLPARAPDVLPGQIALFVGAVSLLVALQIAGHALIAALDRFTHVLLAFWVLASLVSIEASLWLCRRGA